MKKSLFILLSSLLLTACGSVFLKKFAKSKFQIDTEGNSYKAVAIMNKPVQDFELKASIEFKESYRYDGTAWAGFLIKTDVPHGKHSSHTGYLCFVREDGEIGIHESGSIDRKIKEDTYEYGMKFPQKREIRIRCEGEECQFHVDEQLIYTIRRFQFQGGYTVANAGGGNILFDIDYLKAL